MAEVVSIKTGKAPVEYVTVKLSKAEALDLATAYRRAFPYFGTGLVRTLERAARGETDTLTAPTFADIMAASVAPARSRF